MAEAGAAVGAEVNHSPNQTSNGGTGQIQMRLNVGILPVKNGRCGEVRRSTELEAIKRDVHVAAESGDLKKMRLSLQDLLVAEIDQVVHSKIDGTTPMLTACKCGHLPIIRFLVRECEVDIEQTGSITFDGEKIQFAPPLWVAAAAGHLPIVKFLVQHGANVNNTTKSNSTPLRAACYDGHLDVVRYLVQHGGNVEVANSHGHTCMMIACFRGHIDIVRYLLKLGALVNRKSHKGNTALHDCAEADHLSIMKLLIEKGALMEKDGYGLTPLLAAANNANSKIVAWLTTYASLDIDREEIINSYELLGASYIDRKSNLMGALKYWRYAMHLRYQQYKPVIAKQIPEPIAAYGHIAEIRTKEDVEALSGDPEMMKLQALMIRERVLGPRHADTWYYVRYRGAVYADSGDFESCIRLWMYALNMQKAISQPMNLITISSLLSFAELYLYIGHSAELIPKAKFVDLYNILEVGISDIQHGIARNRGESDSIPSGGGGSAAAASSSGGESRDRLMSVPNSSSSDQVSIDKAILAVLHILVIISKIQAANQIFSQPQMHQFMKLIHRFVMLDPRRESDNATPLHMAVNSDTKAIGRDSFCCFPSPSLVTLLLQVNANPNSSNVDGNTPLHIVGNQMAQLSRTADQRNLGATSSAVAVQLLKAGAHYDMANMEKDRPFQSCPPSLLRDFLHPIRNTNLQCICARLIVKSNIPYQEILSSRLAKFVSLH